MTPMIIPAIAKPEPAWPGLALIFDSATNPKMIANGPRMIWQHWNIESAPENHGPHIAILLLPDGAAGGMDTDGGGGGGNTPANSGNSEIGFQTSVLFRLHARGCWRECALLKPTAATVRPKQAHTPYGRRQ